MLYKSLRNHLYSYENHDIKHFSQLKQSHRKLMYCEGLNTPLSAVMKAELGSTALLHKRKISDDVFHCFSFSIGFKKY